MINGFTAKTLAFSHDSSQAERAGRPRTAGLAVVVLTAAGTLAASPALADPTGVWQRDTGSSRMRVAPCGPNLCGTLIWVKDASGPAKVGQRVLYDLKANGTNKWSGSAFNPEDGKTYTGTMTLSGSTLSTGGCIAGGLICRTVNWVRAN